MTNQEAEELRKSFIESDIVKYYNEKGEKMAAHRADTALRMKKGGAIKANAIRKPGQRSDAGKKGGEATVKSGHLASLRTKEHQSSAGKKGGEANVKSGHFASLKTKEHQSSAGKKGGEANVKSGNWDKAKDLGTKQSAINRTNRAAEKAANILYTLGKSTFSVKDLHIHIISLGYAKSYVPSFLNLANVELVKRVKYNSAETIYKIKQK